MYKQQYGIIPGSTENFNILPFTSEFDKVFFFEPGWTINPFCIFISGFWPTGGQQHQKYNAVTDLHESDFCSIVSYTFPEYLLNLGCGVQPPAMRGFEDLARGSFTGRSNF
jgi:hypothetical protein